MSSTATRDADIRHMTHALGLAQRGLGQVWPNPAVGCVIVQGDRVVGRGWTAPGGRPHAEPLALAQAGAAAQGATAYVTLEPCAHHGQTPPCAAALVAAGVARVVTGQTDPDPRVAGRGHAMLQAAGIAVTTDVLGDAARVVQAGFLHRVATGRPLVTLKLALSLDGRIATAAGESRWITGPAARARVHLMRAQHDAVLVGGGTARADDPELTVRGLGIARQPVRIIAAAGLDLPAGGRLAASVGQGPLWLIHGPAAPAAAREGWVSRGARLIECPAPSGRVDPVALLDRLGAEGLTRVLCEGGGAFGAALVAAGLVQRIEVFAAGLLLGGDARAGLGPLGLERLAAAPRFRLQEVQEIGGDIRQVWLAAG